MNQLICKVFLCASPPSPVEDRRGEEWTCERLMGRIDELGQSQDSKGLDETESDITYGEVEHRLDLLQEHLNR